MKRTAIIVFAMLLFAGCGPLKVTEFYTRYQDRPVINVVSFVGYRINDSIPADMTVIQAVDDSLYAAILPEFGLTRTCLGFHRIVVSGPEVSRSLKTDHVEHSYTVDSGGPHPTRKLIMPSRPLRALSLNQSRVAIGTPSFRNRPLFLTSNTITI